MSAVLPSRVAEAAGPGAWLAFRAPGRANLIGEHTDYNDGFVMPAAIGLEIRLAILPTDDRRVAITLDVLSLANSKCRGAGRPPSPRR